jgi:hypothetical protein
LRRKATKVVQCLGKDLRMPTKIHFLRDGRNWGFFFFWGVKIYGFIDLRIFFLKIVNLYMAKKSMSTHVISEFIFLNAIAKKAKILFSKSKIPQKKLI